MTPPNRHLPGQCRHFTRRTTQRRFFLRPDRKGEVNNIVGYCYALAALTHNITIHALVVMSNHAHLIATDHDGNCSRFTQDAHSKIAQAMNARLKRRESFFRTGKGGNTFLTDSESVVDAIFYTLMNPVEAGLVAQVDDWKGLKITPDDWGNPMTFTRPDFFGDNLPDEVTIVPQPSSGLAHHDLAVVQKYFRDGVAEREEAQRKARRKRRKKVLGMGKCYDVSPFATPKKSVPMYTLNPRFSGRNKSLIAQVILRMRAFWLEHRAAWNVLKSGASAEFPSGCVRYSTLARATSRGDPHVPHYTRFVF
jgi:REP element-mobilizing transposase RayT